MRNTDQEKLPVLLRIRGEQYFDGIDPDQTELMTEGTLELTEQGGIMEIQYSIAVEHTVTGRNCFKIRVKRK